MVVSKRNILSNIWSWNAFLHQKQATFFLIIAVLLTYFHVFEVERSNAITNVAVLIGICLSYWRFSKSTTHLFSYAIISATILLSGFPVLSDDVIRFFWDAKLLSKGISPYSTKPMGLPNELWPLVTDLLYTKNYFSVYPPILQLLYLPSVLMEGEMKYFMIGGIFALIHYGFGILTYLKNRQKEILLLLSFPIFLIEGIGNVHAELLLIWPLYWLFHIKKAQLNSGLFIGIMSAIKLWPILLSPFLIKRGSLNNTSILLYVLGITIGLSTLLLFGFFWNFPNIMESLKLYQSKFAFFGGIHLSLIQFISEESSRIILKCLLGISFIWIFLKNYTVQQKIFLAIIAYSFFTPNIHPWYLIPIGVLMIIHDKTISLSTIFFSIGLCLSYLNYQDEIYSNLLWVAICGNLLVLIGILLTWRSFHLHQQYPTFRSS